MDNAIARQVYQWLQERGIAPDDIEVVIKLARKAAPDIGRSAATLKRYIRHYRDGSGPYSNGSPPDPAKTRAKSKDPRFQQAYDPDDVSPEELGLGPDPDDEDRPIIIRVASKYNPTFIAVMDFQQREYLFDFDDEPLFDVPFDVVQTYLEWYTYKGLGLTQAEVARESATQLERPLTETYFQWMLKALACTKKSTPFAPHMFYEHSPQHLVKGWREQDEALVEQKYRVQQVRYLQRQHEKLTHQLNTFSNFVTESIEQAKLEAVEVDVPELPKFNVNTSDNDYTPGLLLSDLHYGKHADLDENQFNHHIAKERMELWAELVYEHFTHYRRKMDRMLLFVLGDMIDGPMGDMHPQHWLRQDVHGRKQVVGAANILARAAAKVEKMVDVAVEAFCVSGNHGRARKSRDEDPQRLAESLMYEIAAAKCPQVKWTIFDGEMGQTRVRNTVVYLSHGSKTPKDLRKLGWAIKGDNVLVLSGHNHCDQRDGFSDKHVLSIKNGAACGVDSFERDQLAKAYRPSQAMVEIDDRGPNYGKLLYLDSNQPWR